MHGPKHFMNSINYYGPKNMWILKKKNTCVLTSISFSIFNSPFIIEIKEHQSKQASLKSHHYRFLRALLCRLEDEMKVEHHMKEEHSMGKEHQMGEGT